MRETTLLPHKINRERVVYKDEFQTLIRVVAEFDGFTKSYNVSERGERAALLVVRDGQVLLARQYRLIVNEVALEIPGGGVEEGEDPSLAAARECREETGIEARNPQWLVCYHPSLDILRNYTHIYYSEECTDFADVEPDRRTWLPLSRCLEMIFAQEMTDVLTIVAILAYLARKHKQE
jgi:8-oxo-dGTP pyrophosphatase MutT (NUDIX family)